MKILIATDGSKQATAAVDSANRLLNSENREVDLLCVAPRPRKEYAGEHGYRSRALREMTQILDRARCLIAAKSARIQCLTGFGSPSGTIVGRAEDYDLTIIGSKSRGAAGEAGLGPVASRVVEHAAAPVLIAREMRTDEASLRVLAAVDGSTASLHALETLGELFDLGSAEVCLMYVAETPWIESASDEDWDTASDENQEPSETSSLEQELVSEGDTILDRAREPLRPLRVAVTTRLSQGNPANELLSEAERGEYDLIVLGATGVRDLKHHMLGSVSFKVAWNAPCSVLIVREPE